MDKNMINIDDLLKQRLPNGEERQRPGAWLQMRELLDQQMPVASIPAPGAAFNWRRMFSYLAGLALLATVSIGSYQVSTSYRSDDAIAQTAARAANTTATGNTVAMNTAAPANTSSSTSSINNTSTANSDQVAGQQTVAESATDNNTNSNKNNNNNKAAATVADNDGKQHSDKANNNPYTPARSQEQIAATNKTAKPGNTGSDIQKTTSNAHSNVLVDNSKATATKAIASSTAKPTIADNNTGSSVKQASTASHQPAAEPKTTGAERNFASGAKAGINLPGSDKAALKNGPHNTAKQTNGQNPGDMPDSGAPTTAGGVNNKPHPKLIDKVETKETYDRVAGWRKDTVATGKVEWSSKEPAMMLANNTLSSNAVPADVSMIPNASAIANSETTNSSEALVPLANFKVDSKKDSHYAKARRFEQMMQNAKTNMGTVRFYPGLILGANTTMGNNSMSGFQFGVTGMLSLNDKWGILSELKYTQRFKKDSRIQDNYTQDAQPYNFTPGGTVYQYSSIDRYINYSTISNLELPIALNYSVKRFNFLGGVNLAYNFGINIEEIQRQAVIQYTAPLSSAEIPSTTARLNAQPALSNSDFKARTSLGYLLGAAYQISPAFKLDLRMTQNLTDNAKTTGAKKISKELYSSPTLQLNLNYRFSSNKNRPAKAR